MGDDEFVLQALTVASNELNTDAAKAKTFFAKESDRWIDTALKTAADDVKEAWSELNAMLNSDHAMTVARERFARCELTVEEFEKIRDTLRT